MGATADASIVMGAGRLTVSPDGRLVVVGGKMPRRAQPVAGITTTGGRSRLRIEPPGDVISASGSGQLDVRLARTVRWNIEAVPAAASTVMDLRGLSTGSVKVAGGVGDVSLTLDDDRNVEVAAGVSNVVVRVPSEAAVTLTVGSGLALVDAPGFERVSGGFPIGGGTWARAGAGPRISVRVGSGIANVSVMPY